MREHKVRIWNKTRKAFFAGDITLKTKELMKSLGVKEGDWMIFTGLRDRNGTEIYEGDIVKDLSPYAEDIDLDLIYIDPLEYIVYYCDAEAQFRMKNDEYGQHHSLGGKTLAIVGNIHDRGGDLD